MRISLPVAHIHNHINQPVNWSYHLLHTFNKFLDILTFILSEAFILIVIPQLLAALPSPVLYTVFFISMPPISRWRPWGGISSSRMTLSQPKSSSNFQIVMFSSGISNTIVIQHHFLSIIFNMLITHCFHCKLLLAEQWISMCVCPSFHLSVFPSVCLSCFGFCAITSWNTEGLL